MALPSQRISKEVSWVGTFQERSYWVERVQGAEVEDVYVVLYGHLGTREAPGRPLCLMPTEAPGSLCSRERS